MSLKDRSQSFARVIKFSQNLKIYPYFKPISRSWGPEVEVDGKRLIMVGSNDYLGLTHHPKVTEAAKDAVGRWGAGPGGSRFLCGNLSLHEMLEERLADMVGKKHAIVHTAGFLANLGAIGCMATAKDALLCDRENHASIFEGCRSACSRIISFAHNDAASAAKRLASNREKNPDAEVFLITEGVFSMSGDVAALDDLVALKDEHPELMVYLDDAHGLGVMGDNGRGTANHFGVTDKVDFIMGTFSKALASIGGFVATDDDDVAVYLKHHSRALIFSAALPASNVATVLTCLDIIENEPERVQRLWEITNRVRHRYEEIGLIVRDSLSPIVPIYVGSEEKAAYFSAELFKSGVFALPAVYPAVPKGQALIRTAYMSTHEDHHIDYVLDQLERLAKKFNVRYDDFDDQKPFLAFLSDTDSSARDACSAS